MDNDTDIYKNLEPGCNQIFNSSEGYALIVFDKILNFDLSSKFLVKNREKILYWCGENYSISENYILKLESSLEEKYYLGILYLIYHTRTTLETIRLSTTGFVKIKEMECRDYTGKIYKHISHQQKIKNINSVINNLNKAKDGISENMMAFRDIRDLPNHLLQIQDDIEKITNKIKCFERILKNNPGYRVDTRIKKINKKFMGSIFTIYCMSDETFRNSFESEHRYYLNYCMSGDSKIPYQPYIEKIELAYTETYQKKFPITNLQYLYS